MRFDYGSTFPCSQFHVEGFKFYRRDRVKGGGGIAGVPADLDPPRFDLSASRYGPPGPNPLADMDPPGPNTLADLDPLRGFGPPNKTE